MDWVKCTWCSKSFLKYIPYINENRKLGHKFYCSLSCFHIAKVKLIEFVCENTNCKKKFRRQPSDISPHNYCSRSCAAIVNNVKFPRKRVVRKCHYCSVELSRYRKYCSSKCKSNALIISKEKVIGRIRKFYEEHSRVPVKREMWGIYKPARKYFGSWNNAVEAAGFDSNPVMFAKHQIANDGHICDSLAEKLIDDYLYNKNIQHQRCVSYPESECTADFKIGDTLVEYFGLVGEHKRYDELREIKRESVKKFRLNLIEIFPKDLYPHNRLEAIFGY